jgi:DNA-binding NarL/FixJ family response regulator
MSSVEGKDSPASSTRLVIAEDHALVREGVRSLLEREPDLEVVGEAEDGREAVELCRRLRPKLALVDLRMPEIDGIAATRAIKRELPHTIVLILTGLAEPDYLLKALKAGAAGYVLKYTISEEMLDAIRKALSGESPLDEELVARSLRQLADEMHEEEKPADLALGPRRSPEETPVGAPDEHPEAHLLLGLLTPREAEVLRLMARGHTNREIAQELSIALSTVKNHVHTIIAKLEVSDRTQAAVRGVELGLFPAERGEEGGPF